MVNVTNVKTLADIIRQQPHVSAEHETGFDMSVWEHDCGTPACIAGWASSLACPEGRPKTSYGRTMDAEEVANIWLDLTYQEGSDLYIASGLNVELSRITPEQAATVLDHLAETGKVDWSVIKDQFASEEFIENEY